MSEAETPVGTLGAHSQLLGTRLLGFDRETNTATVAFVAREEVCSSRGAVQGGLVAGFLDEAMGLACIASTNGEAAPLNLELSISLLKPIPAGAEFTGKGRVVRAGKRAIFLESELIAQDGTIYARATSTALPSALPRG